METKFNQIQDLIIQVNKPNFDENRVVFTCNVKKIICSDGTIREPEKEEFPNNNQIFYTSGYDKIIKGFFKAEGSPELPVFKIPISNIEKNKDPKLYTTDPTKTLWVVTQKTSIDIFSYLVEVINIPSFIPSLNFNWSRFIDIFPNSNQFFYIQNNVSLFGPFTYNSFNDTLSALKFEEIANEDSEIRVNELNELNITLDSDFCEENESFIFEYDNNNSQLQFLEVEGKLYLLKVPNKEKNKYYFGDKTELEEFVKRSLSGVKKSDFELLDKFLKSKEDIIKFNDEKIVIKIQSYFSTIDGASKFYKEELPKVLGDFLRDTEDGKKLLADYIKKHPDELPIDSVYEGKLSEKDSENKKMNQDIELLKNELEEFKSKPIFQEAIDLGFSSEEEKKYFLENKNKLIEISKNEESRYYSKFKLEEIKKEIEGFKLQETEIKNTIDKFKDGLPNKETIAASALTFQITSDIISGEYDIKKNKKKELEKTLVLSEFKPEIISFKEYREEVKNNLDKLGRSFDDELLSNYLVTLDRNFLTVFLGYPGVGKTSLVEKIAQANGLRNTDSDKNRFKKISVEKGWNSTRDLLGFYNSINNKWIDSKTGLKQIIEQLNHEEVSKHHAPAYWILLDEANLSPIENYWANFNSMADDDNVKEITLENGDELKWSNDKLRFIATVNFDHTTEPLSPRLISRGAIIKLDLPKDIKTEKKDFNLLSTPLSVKVQFEKESSKSITPQINKIKDVLMESKAGMPIIMSPRKEKAIKEHFRYLEPIIDDEAGALDFAILQHLLPIISGQGDLFRRRLEDLKRALIGLPKSLSEVERIIETGTQYQMFSFFNI